MNSNILVIPGAYDRVQNYGGYPGIDIWMRDDPADAQRIAQADWIIAASSGPNFAFSHHVRQDQKFILINPLVKQRSFFELVIRDIKFLLYEGVDVQKMIPFSRYAFAFQRARQVTKVNVLDALRKLPKEHIFIIRGTQDRFFCEDECLEIIKREGFHLTEVDAGHLWNQYIAEAVKKIIEQN